MALTNRQSNHWNAYWRSGGAGRGEALTGDAPGDKFDAYWRDFFADVSAQSAVARIVDLACGAGVVIKRAAQYFDSQSHLCGVDYAFHAAASLTAASHQDVDHTFHGVAASAEALPFADRSIDVIVSQFGVEYAGLGAFSEAARVLGPGGVGQLIVHYKGGGIDQECADNAAVLEAILEARLFEMAETAFTGDAAALQKLNSAFNGLTPLCAGAPVAAKGLLRRLLSDVERLISRRSAYASDEALNWLRAMRAEIATYEARMRAMTQAALSSTDMETAREKIVGAGAIVDVYEPVTLEGKDAPAAWRLVFRRERA